VVEDSELVVTSGVVVGSDEMVVLDEVQDAARPTRATPTT